MEYTIEQKRLVDFFQKLVDSFILRTDSKPLFLDRVEVVSYDVDAKTIVVKVYLNFDFKEIEYNQSVMRFHIKKIEFFLNKKLSKEIEKSTGINYGFDTVKYIFKDQVEK
jgi:hypothetical protein